MTNSTGVATAAAVCATGLVGAGACWFVAGRNLFWGRRWLLGWSLISLALLVRAAANLPKLYSLAAQPQSLMSAMWQTASAFLLALQPLLLIAGLVCLMMHTNARSIEFSTGRRWGLALDTIVFSGSMAALLWWFWIEPFFLRAGTHPPGIVRWIYPLVALANISALALLLLSTRSAEREIVALAARQARCGDTGSDQQHPLETSAQRQSKAMPSKSGPQKSERTKSFAFTEVPPGSILLCLSLLLLAIADCRAVTLSQRATNVADAVLLSAASLLIGMAAWWHWKYALEAQRQQTQQRLYRATSGESCSGQTGQAIAPVTIQDATGAPLLTTPLFAPASLHQAVAHEQEMESTGGDTSHISGSMPDVVSASFLAVPLSEDSSPVSSLSRPQSVPQDLTILEKLAGLSPHPLESLLTLILPCVATLAGIWHLNGSTSVAGSGTLRLLPNHLGEAWWGPVLITLAVVRHSLLHWQSTQAARALRDHALGLKKEVEQRTHQLSTLHAVAADLNNTLNREQVLSTALERMMDAVCADAGAVWLRVDFDVLCELGETGTQHESYAPGEGARPGGAAGINGAKFFRRESERRSSTGLMDEVGGAETPAAARWRLVRSGGHERDAQRHALNVMNEALERGGLAHCAMVCSTQVEIFGSAHVVPVRWKGEVMGALGIMRWQGSLETAERTLLESIALEVGAALQNAHLYQEARRRADVDGVTGLFNHRSMQERLGTELAQARAGSKMLTIVMMDLNNFKFFNDTYGHPVGDGVLRTVAQCLRDTCRTDDIIGRYGGDEFVALLPDTDAHGALEVCSRIAARIEEEAYQGSDGRKIPIGLSFGAAVFPHDGEAALDLLTVADANLYEAKRGGAPLMIQRAATEETEELRQLKAVGVGGSFGVLDALVTAIDNKDHYTRSHSEDVTHWATLMARELGYSSEVQRAVRICGLLHDVGKIAVPDSILRKPGRLNDDEFKIMQQHPVFGALIVKDVPNLTDVLGGIRHHHERFDGKGYPDKLTGQEIPMLGRLLAVPDCFSAMTTDRPYRKALTWSEALNEIERGRGTQFDPVMADAFLEVMARIVGDNTNKSFDKDGARQSVLQHSASGSASSHVGVLDLSFMEEEKVGADCDTSVTRPRSVMDAEIEEPALAATVARG